MVWELPSKLALDGCVYDNALFTGNDTAGVGLGFWVTATKEPKFYGCGVFGHCEEFGQKVSGKRGAHSLQTVLHTRAAAAAAEGWCYLQARQPQSVLESDLVRLLCGGVPCRS